MHDHIRESITQDILASLETGAPMIACLLGARQADRSAPLFTLGPDPLRPAAAGGAGLVGVVTLADLALGGAIRRRVGIEHALQTVSLSLQMAEPLPAVDFEVRAEETLEAVAGFGAVRGQVVARGRCVADLMATFNIPASGPGRPPLPWEGAAPAPIRSGNLPDAARELADGIITFAAAPGGHSWPDRLLADACAREDSATVMHPTIAMLNRFGHVQGAILFGLAALDASRQAGGMDLRHGQMSFMSATSQGEPVRCESLVPRRTRGTAFIESRITQANAVVASASFVFRSAP